MIVYEASKDAFLNDCENDAIADIINENVLTKLGRRTPESEYRSWEQSLTWMYKVMNDPEIPNDSGVAIEYNIPMTGKRIDFIISGYDDFDNPSMVIIELKQWQKISPFGKSDSMVITRFQKGFSEAVHPSYQAWSYASLLRDYNESIDEYGIALHPCCYLHNYKRTENDPLDLPQYSLYTSEAPAFTGGQTPDLRRFVKKFIRKGDRKELLYVMEGGKIRPSKKLQDAVASMIEGNEEFVMIDEQRVAFEKIASLAEKSFEDGIKRTLIVKGGPGTGKSVIAINALARLTRGGLVAQYVTKNNAPRSVYRDKLKSHNKLKKSSIDNLFKSSGMYTDCEKDVIDVILADEAHRLNAKSGMMKNLGENQVMEIIRASKCSVFFIDEDQRVTVDDIGTIDEIKKQAISEGSEITETELSSQFRCSGSDGFLAWLDDVLEIRRTANYSRGDFPVTVCQSPAEMMEIIKEKDGGKGKARILAGYCWEWPKETQNNIEYHDIKIGDFEISWNLKDGEIYALSPSSVNEAGCIHTAQGLEFDYVGVIIGEDMRYENNRIVTDFTKRARGDRTVFGLKNMYKKNPAEALKTADMIIKNTYRTLMSRGMKGLCIYAVDKNLNEYLKNRASIT